MREGLFFKSNQKLSKFSFISLALLVLGCINKEAKYKSDKNSDMNVVYSDTTKYDTIDENNYCTVEIISTPYISKQGVAISELPVSNSGSVKYDSLGLQVEFHNSYTVSIKYKTFKKEMILYDYWPDTTDTKLNWSFLRMSKVETSKRTYFYIELGSPWNRHWEYLDEILVDVTDENNVEIYTLPETLYGTSNFGDFDNNSYLDYVQINDSLMVIQMYTLKNGRIRLNKSKYLSLAEVSIPSYWPVYKIIDGKKNPDSWAMEQHDGAE